MGATVAAWMSAGQLHGHMFRAGQGRAGQGRAGQGRADPHEAASKQRQVTGRCLHMWLEQQP